MMATRIPPYVLRISVICVIILIVASAHAFTPIGGIELHAVHITLRKLFILPVVLAATWFGVRGSVLSSAAITLIYLPYVWWDWAGRTSENINQYGELATVWIVAFLAGILMSREKDAIEKTARTHESALIMLTSALDAREHDTQLHSLRVRNYALALGRRLGLDDKQLKTLGEGALLHDVGKIGVPDHILLKRGSLTDEEWGEMRKHPEIGARILSSSSLLADASEIVRHHHEKYDGSGYPGGIKDGEIPLGARIFAVVDAFDALTCDRPYHEALNSEQAVDVLRRDSGTHFDPQVVRAFLQIMPKELDFIRLGSSARIK